jgi:hypothetical protein
VIKNAAACSISWGASVVGRRFGETTVSTTMAENAPPPPPDKASSPLSPYARPTSIAAVAKTSPRLANRIYSPTAAKFPRLNKERAIEMTKGAEASSRSHARQVDPRDDG